MKYAIRLRMQFSGMEKGAALMDHPRLQSTKQKQRRNAPLS
jgi:hypothetical protein